MDKISRFIVTISVCLVSSGCDNFIRQALGTRNKTTYGPDIEIIASVDGIADKTVQYQKTFVLIPANQNVDVRDLEYREFSVYVKNALSEMGWQLVDDPQQADVLIGIGYGIGPPEKHVTTNLIPLIGQTGYSSATTTGGVSTFGNTATYSGTTNYTPTYGVTGYATKVTESTTYTRYMLLDAYDLRAFYKTKQLVPLWRTTVVSVGPTDDLRLIVPGLVTAGLNYYGQDTAGKQTVELNLSSIEVYQIRTGQRVPAPATSSAPVSAGH